MISEYSFYLPVYAANKSREVAKKSLFLRQLENFASQ